MQEYQFNQKEYRKKIYKNGGGSVAILIFICIILIGAAFILMPKKSASKQEFYFVEINQFITYKDANELAISIQEKGGAGYVFFNGSYHVFAGYYPTKSEAETVCENLKEEFECACVFSLEYSLNSKNLSANQKTALSNMVEMSENTIGEIYENILSFVKNENSEAKLKLNFSAILKNFESKMEEFNGVFKDNKFSKARASLEKMHTSLTNLNDITDASKLRYEQISFVVNYVSFLSSF